MVFTVEVECQGFPTQSVWNLMTKVGVTGHKKKTEVRRLGQVAERASSWLWHKLSGRREERGRGSKNSEKVGHLLKTSRPGQGYIQNNAGIKASLI